MAKRTKPTDPRGKLIRAAFESAIRNGWRGLRIAEVAKAAGMTVAEAYKVAPDRGGLLDAYGHEIDAKVAEELAAESDEVGGETWRDKAFDGLMLRFDAMLKDRDALRVIYFDDQRDLVALARNANRARLSIERILEASGFSDDTLGLRLGSTAFLPFYARVFRIWLNDEVDQAKTMAALDKALGTLERIKNRFSRRAETKVPTDSDEEDADEDSRPATNGSTH